MTAPARPVHGELSGHRSHARRHEPQCPAAPLASVARPVDPAWVLRVRTVCDRYQAAESVAALR